MYSLLHLHWDYLWLEDVPYSSFFYFHQVLCLELPKSRLHQKYWLACHSQLKYPTTLHTIYRRSFEPHKRIMVGSNQTIKNAVPWPVHQETRRGGHHVQGHRGCSMPQSQNQQTVRFSEKARGSAGGWRKWKSELKEGSQPSQSRPVWLQDSNITPSAPPRQPPQQFYQQPAILVSIVSPQ